MCKMVLMRLIKLFIFRDSSQLVLFRVEFYSSWETGGVGGSYTIRNKNLEHLKKSSFELDRLMLALYIYHDSNSNNNSELFTVFTVN